MAAAHPRRERPGGGDCGARLDQAQCGDVLSDAATAAGAAATNGRSACSPARSGACRGSAMMKQLYLLFALLLIAAPASAADIKNIDLGKRAEVWFAEDHSVPIIALVAAMPAGSSYDPAG